MKKKVTTYILLVAAVAVWGLIVYRIMQAVDTDEEGVAQQDVVLTNIAEKSEDADTFTIALDYSDPFFTKVSSSASYYTGSRTMSGNAQASASSASTRSQVNTRQAETIDWSFISFNGLIKNASKRTHVALLNIHNKGHMMKEGETIEGVKLLKADKDFVVVQYMKAQKTIKRI